MSRHLRSRRRFVRAAAAAAVGMSGVLAGCNGSTTGDVAVGPGQSLTFEPERVTVERGEAVTWSFESSGHNVSAVPEHSDEISIPDGAEPFASYEGDARFRTVPAGETFEHTFETPGRYTYVCIPHVSSGMIGHVIVE